MLRKEYLQRERRYVPEYVDKTYPERVAVFYNMAVGPAPEDLTSRYPDMPLEQFRRWRFWVDAIVVLKDRVILIEGKIRTIAGAVGQLLLYRNLLPKTPEMAPYKALPVEMLLVTARPDPRIIEMAASSGIRVDIYRPDWILDYLKTLGLA
jgi:hypothetical protein